MRPSHSNDAVSGFSEDEQRFLILFTTEQTRARKSSLGLRISNRLSFQFAPVDMYINNKIRVRGHSIDPKH